jgi:hypothetical protein
MSKIWCSKIGAKIVLKMSKLGGSKSGQILLKNVILRGGLKLSKIDKNRPPGPRTPRNRILDNFAVFYKSSPPRDPPINVRFGEKYSLFVGNEIFIGVKNGVPGADRSDRKM